LGAMDTALRMTTDYLTTRKQFGVTLNRFQALTFRAADMYTSLELTRSIVSWATMVLADESLPAEKKREAASRAKLQVSRAGRHVGQEAIQLHGGIAMTAEYIVGHLTARLTAIDHLLGDGRQQIRNLSRSLTDYGVVEPLP
jgi:alkylation response protein AidB-like acyl-CoA dehydrogenase